MVCGARWTPAQTGKQGLYRLVEQARESYQAEVATHKKSYRRYVLDFIHSTRYHDATDAWSKNEHQKNYHTVVSLLKEHEKLVRRHFDQPIFGMAEIEILLGEFYASDLPKETSCKTVPANTGGNAAMPDLVFERTLDRHAIDLIVQLANEVNLFKENLDAEDVFTRYEACRLQTVTSRNNTRLVLLLDTLATHEIIPYNWQAVIARQRLIVSSSGRKYLDQHDLSSTLNRIKDGQPGPAEKRFLSVINSYIGRIKDRKTD